MVAISLRVMKLAAGKHTLEVTRYGFTTRTENFWLFRGSRKTLTALLKPTFAKASGGRQPPGPSTKQPPNQPANAGRSLQGRPLDATHGH